MTNKQRARLLAIAAARGERGFSTIVQEAIEVYLRLQIDRSASVRAALALRGVLGDEEADHLQKTVRQIRARWR